MNIDKPLCNLKTCRYCHDGNCFLDYERCEYTLVKNAIPHADCRDRLKEVFREYSSINGDMFHLSQIENIIDGEDWL